LGALAQSSGSSALLGKATDELSRAMIQPLKERKTARARAVEHQSESSLKSAKAENAESKTVHTGHAHRKRLGVFLCRRQSRLDAFRLQRLGVQKTSTLKPDNGGLTPPLQGQYPFPVPGTWNPKSINEIDLQLSVRIVRERKKVRKGRRQPSRKALSSC